MLGVRNATSLFGFLDSHREVLEERNWNGPFSSLLSHKIGQYQAMYLHKTTP